MSVQEPSSGVSAVVAADPPTDLPGHGAGFNVTCGVAGVAPAHTRYCSTLEADTSPQVSASSMDSGAKTSRSAGLSEARLPRVLRLM